MTEELSDTDRDSEKSIELNEIVASLLIKQIDSAHMYSLKAKE